MGVENVLDTLFLQKYPSRTFRAPHLPKNDLPRTFLIPHFWRNDPSRTFSIPSRATKKGVENVLDILFLEKWGIKNVPADIFFVKWVALNQISARFLGQFYAPTLYSLGITLGIDRKV